MKEDRSIAGTTGRPPGTNGIRAQAARHAHDCIRALAEVANDEQAPASDRVRAAEVVLSHAVRTPVVAAAADATTNNDKWSA